MRNPCAAKRIRLAGRIQNEGPVAAGPERTGGRGDGRSGMTDKNSSPHIAALQELEAALDAHRRTQAAAGAPVHADAAAPSARRRFALRLPSLPSARRWLKRLRCGSGGCRSIRGFCSTAIIRWLRKLTFTAGVLVTVVLIGGGALWWRLLSGPISLDLATPWLTSAVEQNFGNRYRIEVGGTLLERDAQGRTALRLRDIVLRDAVRRFGRGGAQGRHRHFRRELAARQSARRKLPPGRRQHDHPHRSRWADQCHRRRRAAVQRHRADAGSACRSSSSSHRKAHRPRRLRQAALPRLRSRRRQSASSPRIQPAAIQTGAISRSSRWPSAGLRPISRR